jgi:hypothetical protein
MICQGNRVDFKVESREILRYFFIVIALLLKCLSKDSIDFISGIKAPELVKICAYFELKDPHFSEFIKIMYKFWNLNYEEKVSQSETMLYF